MTKITIILASVLILSGCGGGSSSSSGSDSSSSATSLTISASYPTGTASSFSGISSLSVKVMDNTTKSIVSTDVPFNGNAVVPNLNSSHTYTIVSQGIANASGSGSYYHGYYNPNYVVDGSALLITPQLISTTNHIYTMTANVNGLASGVLPTLTPRDSYSVINSSNIESFSGYYTYLPVSLKDGNTYSFLINETNVLYASTPESYVISSFTNNNVPAGITYSNFTVNYIQESQVVRYNLTLNAVKPAVTDFDKISACTVIVYDQVTNNPQVVTMNFGSSSVIPLISTHTYTIIAHGLANVSSGVFYKGAIQSNVTLSADTTQDVVFTRVAGAGNTYNATATVSGLGLGVANPSMTLMDPLLTLTIDNLSRYIVYSYQPVALVTGKSYTFLSSQSPVINVTTPDSYTWVSTTPSTMVTGTSSFNVTYLVNSAATTGSLVVNVPANPSATSFTKTTGINVYLLDENSGALINSIPTTITFGGSHTFTGLPLSHTYTIVSQGVANPKTGDYYSGGYISGVSLSGSSTNKVLSFTKVSPNLTATATVIGLESSSSIPVLSFTTTAPSVTSLNIQSYATYYVYEPVSLATATGYRFLTNQTVTLGATAPSGSALSSISPSNITAGVTAFTVTYATSQISSATYDYTQGWSSNVLTLSSDTSTLFDSPQVVVINTSYNPSSVSDSCFSGGWQQTSQTITQVSDYIYQITIKALPQTDWQGNVTGQYNLNLNNACTINGGDTVLTGVTSYGVITGVTVDGNVVDISKPCAPTGCKDPGNGKIISGYYPNWAMYSTGKNFPVSSSPYDRLNEIIYAFIYFDQNTGDVSSQDDNADFNQMPVLSKKTLQYPYLRALLSFGGWTNKAGAEYPAKMFDTLLNSETATDNFVSQAVTVMRKAHYQGIDIDWEWWSNFVNESAPTIKQIKLYTKLRAAIDAASAADGVKYRLSIAVSAGVDKIAAIEAKQAGAWATIAGLMDNINVMAYDMHGSFDRDTSGKTPGVSDFQAPWAMETNSPYASTKYDILDSMNAYIAAGVPASKLVLGIPAYGRAMAISGLGSSSGLYQSITGTPFGDFDSTMEEPTGVFLYKCIVKPGNCGATSSSAAAFINSLSFVSSTQNSTIFNQYSSKAQEPWGYGLVDSVNGWYNGATSSSSQNTNIFLTYDDQSTAKYKSQKVLDNGYGGAMIWEIDGDTVDDPTTSLFTGIYNTFNQ